LRTFKNRVQKLTGMQVREIKRRSKTLSKNGDFEYGFIGGKVEGRCKKKRIGPWVVGEGTYTLRGAVILRIATVGDKESDKERRTNGLPY